MSTILLAAWKVHVFDEHDVVRDGHGRFANKPGAALSAPQVRALEWLANGKRTSGGKAPAATTLRALQRRGLVKFNGIYPELTEAGRDALVDGAGPPPNPKPKPPGRGRATPPAASASSAATVASGDFSGLRRVGEQGGSNPGGVFEAADGSRWYVKQAHGTWGQEQALASDLYRAASLPSPPIIVGAGVDELGDGPQIATRFLADLEDPDSRTASAKKMLRQARAGFGMDAWLANWDVGQEGNLRGQKPFPTAKYLAPVRMDVGGSLRYRARGGDKGAAFGPSVTEWTTLRDPRNVSSYLFEDMTLVELQDAVGVVEQITPAKIRAAVRKHGLDKDLADLLIARRKDLIDRYAAEVESLKPRHDEFTPGTDLIATPEGAERLAAEVLRTQLAFRGRRLEMDDQDAMMAALAQIQGYDRKPEVVTKAELKKRVAAGATAIYRGVYNGHGGLTGPEIAEELRSGDDVWWAQGLYGSGMYFTVLESSADQYSKSRGEGPAVIAAALRPDAKVIDWDEALRLQAEELEHLGAGREAFADIGRWAAAHGYDAIRKPGGNDWTDPPDEVYFTVLNRAALIVAEAPRSRA